MRYYLTPVVGDGNRAGQGPFRPKYFVDWDVAKQDYVYLIADMNLNVLEHGRNPLMLIAANTSDEEHTAIVSQPDVIAAPGDLQDTIGRTGLPALRERLEELHIPADHIHAGTTWRVLFRWVTKLFTFHQRHHGHSLHRPFFLPGIGINHTVADLAIAQLRETAGSFGATLPPGVTHATPLREILKHVSDQLPGSSMGGEL